MLLWLSWGDALSKRYSVSFVAKADKGYARSPEALAATGKRKLK